MFSITFIVKVKIDVFFDMVFIAPNEIGKKKVPKTISEKHIDFVLCTFLTRIKHTFFSILLRPYSHRYKKSIEVKFLPIEVKFWPSPQN